jgi:hypothetical protein
VSFLTEPVAADSVAGVAEVEEDGGRGMMRQEPLETRRRKGDDRRVYGPLCSRDTVSR